MPGASARRDRLVDNLGTHLPARVRELVEARRCELWYLLAYGADLSRIEEAFSEEGHGPHVAGSGGGDRLGAGYS